VEDKTFKILAIDGGGIKGLYSSTILEHLEKKYKGNISDYFDMLCGTSTGGLIALALSLKIPTKEISDIYLKNGNKIFPKKSKISNKYNPVYWGEIHASGLNNCVQNCWYCSHFMKLIPQ
jgi:patatin-like phospholipase/acyl hydrolase